MGLQAARKDWDSQSDLCIPQLSEHLLCAGHCAGSWAMAGNKTVLPGR